MVFNFKQKGNRMKKILVLFILGTVVFASPTFADHPSPKLDPAEASSQGHFLIHGNWDQLKRGWNIFVLKLTDSEEKILNSAHVKVSYDMEDMEMNPPDNPVEEKDNGFYEKKIFLGMKGNWKFDATIEKDETKDIFSKVIKIEK